MIPINISRTLLTPCTLWVPCFRCKCSSCGRWWAKCRMVANNMSQREFIFARLCSLGNIPSNSGGSESIGCRPWSTDIWLSLCSCAPKLTHWIWIFASICSSKTPASCPWWSHLSALSFGRCRVPFSSNCQNSWFTVFCGRGDTSVIPCSFCFS